jgi:NAD kinase
LNGKIATLDESGDVSIHLLVSVGKSTFGYLLNMKEKQLKKLAQSLLAKTITIHDRPTKGGEQLDLKSMHKSTKLLKRKAIIQNEIMIHSKFRKPTTNNQKPYSNEA